jgi:hypothetical protein
MSTLAPRAVRTTRRLASLASLRKAGPSVLPIALARASIAPLSTRNLSCTPHRCAAPVKPSKPEPSVPEGPLRDEKISDASEYVRLVDPKSGSLAGPFHTRTILAKLDRTKFFLQQVAPPQPDRATIQYNPQAAEAVDVSALVQFPICKLIDKKDEFDKQRAIKRRTSSSAAAAGNVSKEVQLTWSVTPNDLTHKLSKARKEMLRGARINVVVTTKAGGKKYIKGLDPKLDQQREELLQSIETFLCTSEDDPQAAPIARRLQDVDWQRGGSAAVMSFEAFRK